MLPPPAPIEWTSTAATPTGISWTRIRLLSVGAPLVMRQTSKLVPPMSIAIRSDTPSRLAQWSAAAGPAAGPEASA